jgi:3',5'-cyclic AMP phosphodiesterase CpdA
MTETLRLAHLSDPHLPGPLPRGAEWLGKRGLSALNWLRKRRHLHRAEVAAAVAADLAAHAPDMVAMTGDLVNFGLAREFAAARDWLALLGPPERVIVTHGNHDALARGWREGLAALGPHRGAEEADRPWMRVAGGVALIAVSTAVPTAPLRATGRIGAGARAGLGALIREARGRDLLPVVLMHHPPTAVTARRRRLLDGPETCAVLAAGAGLVLHGHTHRPDLSWIDGAGGRIPVLGVPSASMRAQGEAAGAWRLIALSRGDAGWRASVTERAITPSGDVAPLAPFALALPGPAPCEARAGA